MDAFTSSAEFYEVLSDSAARLDREGSFLRKCLERAPGDRVADLACGTGLHALFMAEAGAEVTAMDLSEEMVAHAAARRPHPAITYRRGDMTEVSGGPWDLALCLGNSLSLLPDMKAVEATFRAVFDSLSPGGIFALQVLNYRSTAAQEPRHRVERRKREDTEVVVVKNLVPHEERTLLSLTFFAFTGRECATVSDAAVLLNLTEAELAAAAVGAGLEVADTYGAFDRSPFDAEKSTDLICVLRKPQPEAP
jgi:2-polyprenyl-3-methyl-5-hydroxy-6-metoxy-1,4-benzoquinol methylase